MLFSSMTGNILKTPVWKNRGKKSFTHRKVQDVEQKIKKKGENVEYLISYFE